MATAGRFSNAVRVTDLQPGPPAKNVSMHGPYDHNAYDISEGNDHMSARPSEQSLDFQEPSTVKVEEPR